MGDDPLTGQNFDYRRECLQKLLQYQAGVFAVDIGNYNILSNHFHLLSRIRPDIALTWTDEQVAWRWKKAWPNWKDDTWIREPTDEEIECLLANPQKLAKARKNLGSLSWYMARVKEPVAKLFNQEQKVTGHFFEQRFGSREILDEAAALSCSAYIDLNQIAAGMAGSLEQSDGSAIQDRIFAWQVRQAEESLQTFAQQNRRRKDLELSVEELKELFLGAERILSPITTEAPLLLVPEHSQVETIPDIVSASDGGEEPDDRSTDPSPETQQSPPAPQRKTKSTKRRKTYRIHHRLIQDAPLRASDQLFINMPWTQYWQFAQCLSDQLERDEPPCKDVTTALPPDLVTSLESLGLVVERVAETVMAFHQRFGNQAGRETNLRESLERRGRTQCRGLRNCRDAFT